MRILYILLNKKSNIGLTSQICVVTTLPKYQFQVLFILRVSFFKIYQSIQMNNNDNSPQLLNSHPIDEGNSIQSTQSMNTVLSETSQPVSEERSESHFSPQKEQEILPFHDPALDAFLTQLNTEKNADAKLQMAIQFMASSLSQKGNPHFKLFWEVRKICSSLFKESGDHIIRAQLWSRYHELSQEARKLKEVLDEQSAFAVEQIELAIQSLEHDIHNFQESISKAHPFAFSVPSVALQKNSDFYSDIQKKLTLLNSQATHINAMRKELIKTDMRIKLKNKFFKRLSALGDLVFPPRKELIKQVSQQFISDVDLFIAEYFNTNQETTKPLAFLREEIKALQAAAKILTLNTQSFTHTRTHLSECWDKIKHKEKERKKEWSKQKAIFKQNAEVARQQVADFSARFQQGELTVSRAQQELDTISQSVKSLELGRDEIKIIRHELQQAQYLITNKIKEEQNNKIQLEQEKETQRKDFIQQLKQQLQLLIGKAPLSTIEVIDSEKQMILDKINSCTLSKSEKQEFDRLFKNLKDIITDKKEQALLSLSDDDKETLQQLLEILKQRKASRQESKQQLDIYRKASESSGLDFQQAIHYNQLIQTEKERFEKIQDGISIIEEKIAELKDKLVAK